MAHYLAISEGKIEFSSCIPAAKTVRFNSQDEAADAVSVAIMATRDSDFNHSSSCYYPGESGRPDFDLDAFFALVEQKLFESGAKFE